MVVEFRSDIDIWRAANLDIQQHGEMRRSGCAETYAKRGDPEGRLLWLRIRRAIATLWTDLFRPRPAMRLPYSRISAGVRTGGELNVHP